MPPGRIVLSCVTIAGLAACGDNKPGILTPEQVVTGAGEGQHVEVIGEVHTVTFDSTQAAARRALLAGHYDSIDFVMQQDDESKRGEHPSYDDTGASYPRTPDHYILIRSVVPDGITLGEASFNQFHLQEAWGLGIHIPTTTGAIDPASPLPEVGTVIRVSGTFHHITWNSRAETVPVIDDAVIEVVSGPSQLAGPGAACTRDQGCNARLICDRASLTCVSPPREIYWADPWHDVNGACDADADCPLAQVCDLSYTISGSGAYAARYFMTEDVGRHMCRLEPGATVASQCPRIYTTRDLVSGRFVAGKEICVRASLYVATPAEDGDTHNQMRVDEPIPYPYADAGYDIFGATTENGPMFKDPALPGGPIMDPAQDQQVIAIGTYRYDPDHGWHEIHPVKAYLAP